MGLSAFSHQLSLCPFLCHTEGWSLLVNVTSVPACATGLIATVSHPCSPVTEPFPFDGKCVWLLCSPGRGAGAVDAQTHTRAFQEQNLPRGLSDAALPQSPIMVKGSWACHSHFQVSALNACTSSGKGHPLPAGVSN